MLVITGKMANSMIEHYTGAFKTTFGLALKFQKMTTWYNNEMGYIHALVEHVVRAAIA